MQVLVFVLNTKTNPIVSNKVVEDAQMTFIIAYVRKTYNKISINLEPCMPKKTYRIVAQSTNRYDTTNDMDIVEL